MNFNHIQQQVTDIFHDVREYLGLSVNDLLDAIKFAPRFLSEQRFIHNQPHPLLPLLIALWCHGHNENQINYIRDALKQHELLDNKPTIPTTSNDKPSIEQSSSSQSNQDDINISSTTERTALNLTNNQLADFEQQQEAEIDSSKSNRQSDNSLYEEYPISSRMMSYQWRYLGYPLKKRGKFELDIDATIQKTVWNGIFTGEVYQKGYNASESLILMIDHKGSMTPFHRYTRQLVFSAQQDLSLSRVVIRYFHNIPKSLYYDEYLTLPTSQDEIMDYLDKETKVLIVSDAGASRGFFDVNRVSSTRKIITRFKEKVINIAWLNPTPQSRWKLTSAEMISYFVPMFSMDSDGFIRLIHKIRGMVN